MTCVITVILHCIARAWNATLWKVLSKQLEGGKKKKGPPLTLHTPGSTAFVLGRIMLFDSVDKGKHQFFKAINKKCFFLNIKIEAMGLLSTRAIPNSQTSGPNTSLPLQSHSASNNLGKGRCNSTSKNKSICQQGFLKSQCIYLLTKSINQAPNLS